MACVIPGGVSDSHFNSNVNDTGGTGLKGCFTHVLNFPTLTAYRLLLLIDDWYLYCGSGMDILAMNMDWMATHIRVSGCASLYMYCQWVRVRV